MSSTTPYAFNLWEEDWIPVMGPGGPVKLSLTEFFSEAHHYSHFNTEIPTMDFALQRILSTVLRQAVGIVESAEESWKELWDTGTFPSEIMQTYQQYWGVRFDLFSPEFPFFQTPGLETAKGEYRGPGLLVATVPNGEPHFASLAGKATEVMEPAEAALWLIHTMAFDISGIKPAAVGDPRAKGGKGYPIGVGWAGRLGGFRIIGQNLFETILLNTRFRSREEDQAPGAKEDLALWEREPLTAAPSRTEGETPAGDADLYTWPSRRMRLWYNEDHLVDRVLVCNGDPLPPQFMEKIEPASLWRYSEPQTKKFKTTEVFMPRSHDSARAAWQRIDSILAQYSSTNAAKGSSAPQPILLERIASYQRLNILPAEYPLLIETMGLLYGNQDAVIEDLYVDRVRFDSRLLLPENLRAQQAVVDLADLTSSMIRQLGYRVRDAREACGASGEDPSSALVTRIYFTIDPLFRAWLEGFNVNSVDSAVAEWKRKLHSLLASTAEKEISKLGPRALIGRVSLEAGKTVSAADQLNFFMSQINKALLTPEKHSALITEGGTR